MLGGARSAPAEGSFMKAAMKAAFISVAGVAAVGGSGIR